MLFTVPALGVAFAAESMYVYGLCTHMVSSPAAHGQVLALGLALSAFLTMICTESTLLVATAVLYLRYRTAEEAYRIRAAAMAHMRALGLYTLILILFSLAMYTM